MNDKEIIKALECCVKDEEVCVKECPLFRTAECVKKLHKLILDLIHRQQEEINHFVEANKMVVEPKTVETDKTEDEILKKLLTQRVEFIPKNDDIEAIQRDAVVNFAERLKENLQNVAKEEIMGREYYLIGLSFIDNLVKEFDKDINVRTNPEQLKGEENG